MDTRPSSGDAIRANHAGHASHGIESGVGCGGSGVIIRVTPICHFHWQEIRATARFD